MLGDEWLLVTVFSSTGSYHEQQFVEKDETRENGQMMTLIRNFIVVVFTSQCKKYEIKLAICSGAGYGLLLCIHVASIGDWAQGQTAQLTRERFNNSVVFFLSGAQRGNRAERNKR